jgi:uncharacterized protein (DUF952 family)
MTTTPAAEQPLFHLVPADSWAALTLDQPDYQPESLRSEGFVHCSFAEQVLGSAAKHFAGISDLLVVELDPARLGGPVRVEDSYGTGTAFPHVYGPIPLTAVLGVRPFDPAGFSGDAGGPASPDR